MTDLRDAVANARVVLLDFDGPVCSVFAGYPARRVADRLRAHLREQGWSEGKIPGSDDPMVVWQQVGNVSAVAARSLGPVLTDAEVQAVESAAATTGAAQLLEACQDRRVRVAIVSNNAAQAICAYLERHDLTRYVEHVEGRHPTDPSLLKPNPQAILHTLEVMHVRPGDCVYVGDSLSDLIAADAAGVRFIGYANKPGKRAAMLKAGAALIADQLDRLAGTVGDDG